MAAIFHSRPRLRKKSGMEVTTGEAGGSLGAIEQLGFAGEVKQFREKRRKTEIDFRT